IRISSPIRQANVRAMRRRKRRGRGGATGGAGAGKGWAMAPMIHSELPNGSDIQVNIAGSVAVITGGARGIGLAIAKSLAADGAKVVLGDILAEDLHQSVRDIRDAGGEAVAVVADVTRDEDVEKLMDTAIEKFGAINIVCANAGIARDGLVLN